ncbi:hypothetical protein PIROE2DRAFT_14711 [Piromyces sp. E2]|nr:hypothetical protein PIROE2DRAFT_14711 [Piromyces sp. E2]|eukprot:OUM59683.1 hypothetical protein PIROE2DRAFT_14711 [Piromyces sp. E2]
MNELINYFLHSSDVNLEKYQKYFNELIQEYEEITNKNKNKKFLNDILNKVPTFDDFQKILILFNIEKSNNNNQEQDKYVVEILMNKYVEYLDLNDDIEKYHPAFNILISEYKKKWGNSHRYKNILDMIFNKDKPDAIIVDKFITKLRKYIDLEGNMEDFNTLMQEYKNINSKNYYNFIYTTLENVSNFQQLQKVFILFDIANNTNPPEEFILVKLMYKLMEYINTDDNDHTIKYRDNFNILIQQYKKRVDGDNKKYNRFLNIIFENVSNFQQLQKVFILFDIEKNTNPPEEFILVKLMYKLMEYINTDDNDPTIKYRDHFNMLIQQYKKRVDGDNKKYNRFLNNIFEKESKYQYLQKIFILFNIKENKSLDNVIYDYLWNKTLEYFQIDKENISIENIVLTLGNLCLSLSLNNFTNENEYLEKMNEIIKYISKDKDQVISFNILVIFGKKMSDNIVNSLLNNNINVNSLPNKNIIILLSNLSNKPDCQHILLEKLQNKIIDENDIFKEDFSDHLILLISLINEKILENVKEYTDNAYIKNTLKNIDKIHKKIIDNEFSFQQLKIFENLKSNKNIERIKFGDDITIQTDLELLCSLLELSYDGIIKKINKINEKIEKISKVINIFVRYIPNDKRNLLNNYKSILKNLKNGFPIKILENIDNRELKKSYNEAQEIKKMENSKLFIAVYQKMKKIK